MVKPKLSALKKNTAYVDIVESHITNVESDITNHISHITNVESDITNHISHITNVEKTVKSDYVNMTVTIPPELYFLLEGFCTDQKRVFKKTLTKSEVVRQALSQFLESRKAGVNI